MNDSQEFEEYEKSLEFLPMSFLKINKFPTLFNSNYYYKEDTQELEDKFNFKITFPQLFDFIKNFDKIFYEELNSANLISKNTNSITNSHSDLQDKFNYKDLHLIDEKVHEIIFNNLQLIENDFKKDSIISSFKCEEEWDKLNFYFNGWTKVHTIIVIIFTYIDLNNGEIKNNLSNYDKNILLWVALFHDIGKHVKLNHSLGEKFNEKVKSCDKLHPFKSAAIMLKLFFKHDFIKSHNSNDDKSYANIENLVDDTYHLLTKSGTFLSHKHDYILSLENFREIMNNLKQLIELNTDNKFIYDVIVLIAFHQSLPNMKEHMNHPLLEDEMIKEVFYSSRLIELMRILMVNDSAAHSMFARTSFSLEVNENLDNVQMKYKSL
jgi:hypothetical protein